MNSWLRVMLRELKMIFADKRIFVIMLIGPFFYGIIFGAVYWQGRVREVPVMVIDQDHSRLSRELAQAVDASDGLKIAYHGTTVDDFAELVKRGEAFMCLYIPADFGRDLKRGHQSRVEILTDGSNTLIGNVVYRSVRTVIGTYRVGARAKRLMANGIPKSAVLSNASPIQAEFRPLFNPAYNYSTFLLMGLTCIALQQVTLLGASIALGMENDPRRRRSLREISRRPFVVLAGTALVHFLIMTPLAFLAIYLPFSLFQAAFHGSWTLVLGMTAAFILVQILCGFGVAGMCGTSLRSAQVLLVASVPAFILSGFTWPTFGMPQWARYISYSMPITHFADLVRTVSLMGTPMNLLRLQIAGVLVWIPISAAWGYWGVRRFLRTRDPGAD